MTFMTISGWLAVPYNEYMDLTSSLKFSEQELYDKAKLIADERNEFHGTNEEFKLFIKNDNLSPLIDFINVHYSIYRYYRELMY